MTKEEIKIRILASNPSRTYIVNDQEFEMTDEEFNEAVENRAQMEYEQFLWQQEKDAKIISKVSAYRKLDMSDEEITALMNFTPEETIEFLEGN